MDGQGGGLSGSHGLGPEALEGLLARLGPDPEAAAGEYQRLHRRLVVFFESHGSLEPGRDADETLDRLARKLREGFAIRDVPAYVHGLARNVLREAWRRARREEGARKALRALPPLPPPAGPDDRRLWDCFDRCLDELGPERAELLLAYYSAARSSSRAWRAELAASRGLSLNALRIRVFRAREAIREGLARCLAGGGRP
jgi:DNA-directed RNA polymerase specialized sigma24 family protein